MKAAVVHEFGAPLTIEELPTPTPGEGELLVRVEASGLCHTDIHAARGDWPVKPKLPLIPGHEGVGIVEAIGPGPENGIRVGDRVALPWLGYACGHCKHCEAGWETLCEEQLNMGYFLDGAYAEYVKGYSRHVVKVPEGVDPFAAAPLTCAGVTTYKAVKVSGARPASLVAVWGAGGLGHMAIQYARAFGSSVVAVDLHDEKLATARELGAEYTINAATQDAVAEITELGGADSAIVTAPTPVAFRAAFDSMSRGGTLVFVGLPAHNEVPLPIFETVLKGITIRGSIVGTHLDLEEVFRLHLEGRTQVRYEKRRLGQVNEAFQEVLQEATHQPRLVFEMS
jgi:propanol-preferring alcohol dehydrogenase